MFVESDDLAIENRGLGTDELRQVAQIGVLTGEVVLVARDSGVPDLFQ